MNSARIHILGAGLVGALLGTLLARKGFEVHISEKRRDPRLYPPDSGRSINLALSHRGIRSLKMAGVLERVSPLLVPVHGRMMHGPAGQLTSQPYGSQGQCIYSVPRAALNKVLIEAATDAGATLGFGEKCEEVNLPHTAVTLSGRAGTYQRQSDLLIGADGAFSAVRTEMMKTDRFDYAQQYIAHGYKELTIPALNEDFALDPNFLHIWPRKRFMLIALPNTDRSFTCTLFFPFEGEFSFAALQSTSDVQAFFEQEFADVIPLMPNFVTQFQENPTASLVTIRCAPWYRHRALLIGDACHAIVPFYGQGMNAGFEDCRILMELGEQMNFDWDKLLPAFSNQRKPDTDAIGELAMQNFVEMRDRVADERFLKIKKLEARLHQVYPNDWIPLYTMVTFSDMPYREAATLGSIQAKLAENLPADFDPETHPLEPLMEAFNIAKKAALKADR